MEILISWWDLEKNLKNLIRWKVKKLAQKQIERFIAPKGVGSWDFLIIYVMSWFYP